MEVLPENLVYVFLISRPWQASGVAWSSNQIWLPTHVHTGSFVSLLPCYCVTRASSRLPVDFLSWTHPFNLKNKLESSIKGVFLVLLNAPEALAAALLAWLIACDLCIHVHSSLSVSMGKLTQSLVRVMRARKPMAGRPTMTSPACSAAYHAASHQHAGLEAVLLFTWPKQPQSLSLLYPL